MLSPQALFIISVFLSLLSFVFTTVTAHNKSKQVAPSPGSCSERMSACAASVVPEWFVFVFAITATIIGALGCVVSSVLVFNGSTNSIAYTISNGAGVACAAISVITSLVAAVVDSSARCCCRKAGGAALPTPSTNVTIVTASPMAYAAAAQPYAQPLPYAAHAAQHVHAAQPYAQPLPPPPPAASNGLPPGWTQQSDGSGSVWYVSPTGESQWTAPKF